MKISNGVMSKKSVVHGGRGERQILRQLVRKILRIAVNQKREKNKYRLRDEGGPTLVSPSVAPPKERYTAYIPILSGTYTVADANSGVAYAPDEFVHWTSQTQEELSEELRLVDPHEKTLRGSEEMVEVRLEPHQSQQDGSSPSDDEHTDLQVVQEPKNNVFAKVPRSYALYDRNS